MVRHAPDGVLIGRYFRTAASRARADEGIPVTCHRVEPGRNGSNADPRALRGRGWRASSGRGPPTSSARCCMRSRPTTGRGRLGRPTVAGLRRGRGHNPDAVRIVIGKLRASSGSVRHPWNTHRRFYWTFGLTLTPWTGCPESRVREVARRWRRARRRRMFDFSKSCSHMPFSTPLCPIVRPHLSCSP